MKDFLTIACPAKINLSLDVIKKREDGYHELEMIMQTVDVYDYVSVRLLNEGINVTCDKAEIPEGEGNICYKACKVFFENLKRDGGAEIVIKKNIPQGAGMAGGSTDAAGVLKALNILTGFPFEDACLEKMAKKIGADVPFFIKGGCQLCRGIGEILTPIEEMKDVYLVIAKPPVLVSTPWVYKNLKLNENLSHPETEKLVSMLENGAYECFEKYSLNLLESVTISEYPEIEEYKTLFRQNGAFFTMMTGSGSAVYGIFNEEEKAQGAFETFKEITKDVYMVKM